VKLRRTGEVKVVPLGGVVAEVLRLLGAEAPAGGRA
jgi:hypothetical protein